MGSPEKRIGDAESFVFFEYFNQSRNREFHFGNPGPSELPSTMLGFLRIFEYQGRTQRCTVVDTVILLLFEPGLLGRSPGGSAQLCIGLG